jgi:hypothetical protein
MRPAVLRACALAVTVCLGTGGLARADYIAQFNFTPTKTTLFSTNDPTLGKIILSDQSPAKAEGDTTLVATNITTWASATTDHVNNPAIFKNVPFGLTLTITDFKSGKTDTMLFTGMFNGTLSQGAAKLFEMPTSPTTMTKAVGAHIYTVTVGPYVPPGNPTSGTKGSLGATATIKVTPVVTSVPEPSALVLAACGTVMAVGGWWYRRRRRACPA